MKLLKLPKNFFVSLCVIIGGISLTFLSILLVKFFILTGAFSMFYDNPPEPKIKYSEFDYVVEYSINDVNHIKNGVIKCKYDGIKSLGTAGKFREWSLLTSDNVDRIVLWDVSDQEVYTTAGYKITEFYLDIGTGGYYMDDKTSLYCHGIVDGFVSYKYIHPEHNIEVQGKISNEEALEKYKVHIVSHKIDPPIKNSFG